MLSATNLALDLSDRGLLPDAVLRRSIRFLNARRLAELQVDDCEARSRTTAEFIAAMDAAPIAPLPEKANEQHYEVPAAFYRHALGARLKYSCAYWDETTTGLDAAEENALRLTAEHAGLKDGQEILELGCGWGSLTLWIAENFPNARIRAVSNSNSQREHITAQAAARKLGNIEVLTADMNEFDAGGQFDRVVSVEMFEHMRNYRRLFRRVHDWLRPGGQFMMHIFCHATTPYEFVPRYDSDWMSRYFFSGGIMPSDSLPLYFQDDLKLRAQWRWDGTHYQRTSEAWLANMDRREAQIMPVFEAAFGADAGVWWQRWRIFFLACAELFGTSRGQEWWVSHYCFERPA